MVAVLPDMRSKNLMEGRKGMTDEEKIVRLLAPIIRATEETIYKAKQGLYGNKEKAISSAKESAYDRFKAIMEYGNQDLGFNPWQE